MVTSPTLNTNVTVSDSCNHWFCCFGCKCCNKNEKKITPAPSPDTDHYSIHTTTEKTSRIFRFHRKFHKS